MYHIEAQRSPAAPWMPDARFVGRHSDTPAAVRRGAEASGHHLLASLKDGGSPRAAVRLRTPGGRVVPLPSEPVPLGHHRGRQSLFTL